LKRNNDREVISGFYEAIKRLNLDTTSTRKVRKKLGAYKLQEMIFGSTLAKDHRINTAPRV